MFSSIASFPKSKIPMKTPYKTPRMENRIRYNHVGGLIKPFTKTVVTPEIASDEWIDPATQNRFVRVNAPAGDLEISYRANVETSPQISVPADIGEISEFAMAKCGTVAACNRHSTTSTCSCSDCCSPTAGYPSRSCPMRARLLK